VSLPAPLVASPLATRHFLRRTLGLDHPFPDVAHALAYHGYVQVDPINICGRMHDLILRNRVTGYREGDLHRYIHGPNRPGFEHYLPGSGVLVAFPLDAWPYVFASIQERRRKNGFYGRRLTAKTKLVAAHILDEIARRGPLTSDDIEHEGRAQTAWGTPGRLVKQILEMLFARGHVLITQRRNFRRVYDLTARVLPPDTLKAPPVSARAVARWTVLTRLRQRRLVTLKRNELKFVRDVVQPVTVTGCPPLYCLREDAPLLSEINDRASARDAAPAPLLLAPLDPILYDRRVTAALWNFNYIWEVYTPPPKRVRGYYALPVLAGAALIGHVDPKADRANRKLIVISRRVRRGHQVTPAIRALAHWLGLR
jgi:uncharacterized protein YcaQ